MSTATGPHPHLAPVRCVGDNLHQVAASTFRCPVALDALREGSVEAAQRAQEGLGVLLGQGLLGDEGLHGHVLELHAQPELPGQNERFARDVEPGQVVARVRFGVPAVAGGAHGAGERLATGDGVAQKAQRAGEATVNPLHPVPGADQVLQRLDDGQARAHRRLVAVGPVRARASF